MTVVFGVEAVAHGPLSSRSAEGDLVVPAGSAHGVEGTVDDGIVIGRVAQPLEDIVASNTGKENVFCDDGHRYDTNMGVGAVPTMNR